MNKPEFADHFIMALYNKIPRRPDLVREVSRILRIEQEPASRRLNGSVKFSVNEMGKLSRELGISLDNLMHSENGRIESQAVLETLWRYESIDSLAELIEGHLDIAEGIYPASAEYGCVLDSISLSMAVHHQNIFKLLLFKWGHLFVDSDEFGDYASWNIPRRFTDIRKRLQYLQEKGKGVICVCDDMFVHSIIREVNYLYSVNAIDTGSKNEIKAELHALLAELESDVRNSNGELFQDQGIALYLSSQPIGASCWYLLSDRGHAAFFYSNFAMIKISQNPEYCHAIKRWVLSLKRISTLISGSGYRERRRFFMEQHELVDRTL